MLHRMACDVVCSGHGTAVCVFTSALTQTHAGSLLSAPTNSLVSSQRRHLERHWGAAPVFFFQYSMPKSHLYPPRSRKQAWRLMLPQQAWRSVCQWTLPRAVWASRLWTLYLQEISQRWMRHSAEVSVCVCTSLTYIIRVQMSLLGW